MRDVSNGMLGNKRSSFSNRLIPILPKSENDVRIWAKLERTNPTGLPVGSVSILREIANRFEIEYNKKNNT